MGNTIKYSSELMKNYLQASIMDPQDNFEALQDGNGNAMLFSIGTDGVFYVTQETPGSASGWTKTDLSSALMTGSLAGGTCTGFSVAQNPADGTIGLALVVSANNTDNLLLCMGKSNTNLGWISNPNWLSYAYDNTANPAPTPFIIANVFISETNNGQYIVADLNASGQVSRFYISQKGSPHWNVAPLNIDLDVTAYQSAIGRIANGEIDGMYSAGTINGAGQLIYCPLYNEFGPNLPTTNPLLLPGNIAPQSIATFRNGNSDGSTDLLVTAVDGSGAGGLYYFPSNGQQVNATGQLLIQNPLLVNVSHLCAYLLNGTLTMWGLNGADQVFYLTCPYTADSPGTCTVPTPVLFNVDMMSPYVNISNGGNTIFAVGNDELYIITKSPETTLWTKKQVMLPPPAANTPALQFSSYTTQIQVTNANNQPVPDYQLMISSNTRATFYINYLYYVLDTTPVPISTDQSGNITIIESVNDLTGTKIIVQDGTAAAITINPADSAVQRAVQLNTVAGLQAAVLPGTTTPLVPAGTSTQSLTAVANANTALGKAYTGITSGSGGSTSTLTTTRKRKGVAASADGGDSILSDIGDLFNMIASGVEYVVNIVEDAVSGAWNFIVTIAGQVYKAVIATVEAVAGAIKWVFQQIETLIKDLIKFLEFLFDIENMKNTKEVFATALNLFLQSQASDIQTLVNQFDGAVTHLEEKIDTLAGLPSSWATQYNNSLSSASGAPSPHAPGNMMAYHMQNNVSNATWTPTTYPSNNQLPSLVDTFFEALNNEGEIMDTTLNQLKQIFENASNLTVEQLIVQVLAVFADGLISSVANVLNAIAAILIDLINAAIGDLNQPVYIPVVSDILSFFGISLPSWMDVVCWVMAIPTTIIYELAMDDAPFPTGTATTNLINATSLDQFLGYFTNGSSSTIAAVASTDATPHQSGPMFMEEDARSASTTGTSATSSSGLTNPLPGPTTLPLSGAQQIGFLMFQMSAAITSFLLTPFDVAEANSEGATNAYTKPSIGLAIATGGCAFIADTIAPVYPIQSQVVNGIKYASNVLRLAGKIVFSSQAQGKLANGSAPKLSFLKVSDGRAVGSVFDAILVIPALFCSCWHYYELSSDPSGSSRSLAIVDETGNMVSYVGRIGYAVAVNTEGIPHVAGVAALGVSDLVYGGLHLAEYIMAAD